MNRNFIELNGKRYDAITGELLSVAAQPSSHHTNHTGNVRHKAAAQPAHAAPQHAARPRPDRSHHVSAQQQLKTIASRQPQRAKTLMRHAVEKPGTAPKPTVKQQYPLVTANKTTAIAPKRSAASVDEHRLKRAQAVHKSHHIGRFGAAAGAPVRPKVQPVAIAAAPAHDTAPRTHATTHSKPAAHAPSTPQQTKTNIFEQAIANATSHEQPAHHSSRRKRSGKRRLLNVSAGLAAFLLIGGFIGFMNKSAIELQLASARAGFQASVPDYQPANFQRQGLNAEKGKVAISFVSPGDNSNFTLTQESSNWDSQTLFDSVVASANTSYQTVQSNGRIIYIYGEDQAAWVDGGILYRVSGTAKLNSDQIVSLASSM